MSVCFVSHLVGDVITWDLYSDWMSISFDATSFAEQDSKSFDWQIHHLIDELIARTWLGKINSGFMFGKFHFWAKNGTLFIENKIDEHTTIKSMIPTDDAVRILQQMLVAYEDVVKRYP